MTSSIRSSESIHSKSITQQDTNISAMPFHPIDESDCSNAVNGVCPDRADPQGAETARKIVVTGTIAIVIIVTGGRALRFGAANPELYSGPAGAGLPAETVRLRFNSIGRFFKDGANKFDKVGRLEVEGKKGLNGLRITVNKETITYFEEGNIDHINHQNITFRRLPNGTQEIHDPASKTWQPVKEPDVKDRLSAILDALKVGLNKLRSSNSNK